MPKQSLCIILCVYHSLSHQPAICLKKKKKSFLHSSVFHILVRWGLTQMLTWSQFNVMPLTYNSCLTVQPTQLHYREKALQ